MPDVPKILFYFLCFGLLRNGAFHFWKCIGARSSTECCEEFHSTLTLHSTVPEKVQNEFWLQNVGDKLQQRQQQKYLVNTYMCTAVS
jgi:hypothetical protein